MAQDFIIFCAVTLPVWACSWTFSRHASNFTTNTKGTESLQTVADSRAEDVATERNTDICDDLIHQYHSTVRYIVVVFSNVLVPLHLQHKLIGFYNRDEKCLLRGTNWVFK